MQTFLLVFALLLIKPGTCLLYGSERSDSESRGDEILKRIMKNYDVRLRPNFTGTPTIVHVDLSIIQFGHLEEVNMVFPTDIFFRQRWNDPRLVHDFERSLVLMPGTKHVADILWVPDTVFVDAIESKMHEVTVRNSKLDIHANGDIFWGTRISVRGSCRLDFKTYPMDTQTCSIGVQSYAYTTEHLIYQWHSKPGITILDGEMSQYQITDYTTEELSLNHVTGNYSILSAIFTFKRRIGHAVLRIYFPTIAIVCVSLISLWIDEDSTTARISLCILTLLTLSTIWTTVNSTLPRVSYIKAVDLFFLVSFFFVFFTLIQYVLVLNLSERARARKKESSCKEISQEKADKDAVVENGNKIENSQFGRDTRLVHCPGSKSHENLRRRIRLSKIEERRKISFVNVTEHPKVSSIDKIGRIVLPFGYVMFNIYYWIKYIGSDKLKSFPR